MQKLCTKTSPRPLVILIAQNSQFMQKTLLKIRYFERGLLKNPKKVNLISCAPILFLWTVL